jgi:hypothetical protein
MVLVMLIPMLCIAGEVSAEESDEQYLLVDYGDGNTAWYTVVPDTTLERMIVATVTDVPVEIIDTDDGRVVNSVDGNSTVTIGTGNNRQECSWRVYAWNSVEWEFLTSDVSERYGGGCIALGFYPKDSLKPASNPEYRTVWTSYRGDSSSSGVSDSVGPENATTPVEWYVTYPGAVDGTILYADGMI